MGTTAFQEAKELLTTSKVLVHYDSTLSIRMAADAFAYGIGAVISHVLPNGEEKPIAFASRTLTSSEQNYSQIEKEALAGNADALSRLSLASTGSDVMSDATIYNAQQIASLPLSSKDVEQATQCDPILGRVLEYTRKGWPGLAGEEFKAYYNCARMSWH